MPQIVAAPHTEAWHEARKTALGASEIAAAAGLSIYQTPLELYLRKRGELPPIEETDAMRLGKRLEPVVKAEFCDRTGLKLLDQEPPMYRHDEYSEIVATPDGIITPEVLLETKTANWRMKKYWGDEDTDAIPDQYHCQTMCQMAVMNATMCHVAVLFDGQTLKTYQVHRNDELIDLLLKAGLKLMAAIRDGRRPDPDWSHPTTHAIIKVMCKTTLSTRMLLSPEGQQTWFRSAELGEQIKAMEEEREILRAKVNLEIGEHYAGVLDNGQMVKRITVEPKLVPEELVPAHVRKGKSYLLAVKSDNGRIVERIERDEVPLIESLWQTAGLALAASGAKLRHRSDSGSCYWVLPNGKHLRIADHEPNFKTWEWIQSVGAINFRIDHAADEVRLSASDITHEMARLCQEGN